MTAIAVLSILAAMLYNLELVSGANSTVEFFGLQLDTPLDKFIPAGERPRPYLTPYYDTLKPGDYRFVIDINGFNINGSSNFYVAMPGTLAYTLSSRDPLFGDDQLFSNLRKNSRSREELHFIQGKPKGDWELATKIHFEKDEMRLLDGPDAWFVCKPPFVDWQTGRLFMDLQWYRYWPPTAEGGANCTRIVIKRVRGMPAPQEFGPEE